VASARRAKHRLASDDVWQLLVVQRGWTTDQAAAFVAEALAAALLD